MLCRLLDGDNACRTGMGALSTAHTFAFINNGVQPFMYRYHPQRTGFDADAAGDTLFADTGKFLYC